MPSSRTLLNCFLFTGARRYAVLDFGHPVLLTDVFFPACKDLGSVTIDVWTKGGNLDGRRLAVSLDISNLNLVLNDLLDPPVCRFVKVSGAVLPIGSSMVSLLQSC